MEVFLLQFFDSLYNLINIDVKTTILILFWGNLFFLMMAFAFLISNTHISEKELFKKFIFSKLVQALGWIAFAFRGQIPEIVSVNLGNSLLYFGFYLESMALITITKDITSIINRIQFGIMLAEVVTFNFIVICGASPSYWVGVASVIIISIYLIPAIAYVFNKNGSQFKRFLGSLQLMICIAMVFRATIGFMNKSVSLLSNNFVQSVTFLIFIFLMMINSSGFMLMIYESVNDQLKKLANMDPLTHVKNRRNFMETASTYFSFCKRQNLPLSFLFIDIDYFKKINDQFGHQVGDEALIQTAEIISKNIRESDICGRYGGEEFVVLLPDTDCQTGIEVGNRIRKIIENTPFHEKDTIKFTVSIGLFSDIPKTDGDLDKFIANSDNAMYKAKRTGRNRLCVYDPTFVTD